MFHTLTEELWEDRFRRTLLIGAPMSWKTSSFVSWPAPRGLISYPGEHGVASAEKEDYTISAVWGVDTPGAKSTYQGMAANIREQTIKILNAGVTTFCGDGLHKLYTVFHQAALEQLVLENEGSTKKQTEDQLSGRAYGKAHLAFAEYLNQVCSSKIKYVVFSAWKRDEKVDPRNPYSATIIVPSFPGIMSDQVLGEFGSVFYATPGQEMAPGRWGKGKWQTKPGGGVVGVGLKVPARIASQVPTFVDQDWLAFEQLVFSLKAKTGRREN